jgi:hypothetical protein
MNVGNAGTSRHWVLASGGSNAGHPGIRAEYNPHYYGVFVRDPDGNRIEAVTHSARGKKRQVT